MTLTRWNTMSFAGLLSVAILSSSAAAQDKAKESTNEVHTIDASTPRERQIQSGPTATSVLAADDALSTAIRENNADGITGWLDKDWAVVSGTGDVGEGVSIFPSGITSGVLRRTTFETSEPRVRVYGDVALVTAKVKTSGMFRGKPFDVLERQTDVWHWKDGAWKCVLTHETIIPAKAG